jgi:predicted anti-sigma-YlaC factor YlaD
MRCEDCREAISARLDDEALPRGVTDGAVDDHLSTCAACARFARGAVLVHRDVRVRPAEPVPDMTNAILTAVPAGARPRPVREWARYALLAVALTQLVLALPALVFGEDPGATTHVARELGSFDVALAVGLLWAAWQPQRASGLLPMALALGGAIAVTTLVDLFQGDAGAGAEAHHVLDIAGIVLLYALSRPPAAVRGRSARPTALPA